MPAQPVALAPLGRGRGEGICDMSIVRRIGFQRLLYNR